MFDFTTIGFPYRLFSVLCKVQTFCERLLDADRRSNIDLEDIIPGLVADGYITRLKHIFQVHPIYNIGETNGILQ